MTRSHGDHPSVFTMHVIYEKPQDAPTKFVVRQWHIGNFGALASRSASTHDTLVAARAAIPNGLVCLPRLDADDPVIREVWL